MVTQINPEAFFFGSLSRQHFIITGKYVHDRIYTIILEIRCGLPILQNEIFLILSFLRKNIVYGKSVICYTKYFKKLM